MSRVRIGTCSGPADAALVRSAFEAHQIPVLINAEHHASMLGGLGGAFVPLHIFVDDHYAEDAAELLRDLREHDHTAEAEATSDAPADDDEVDAELDTVAAARTERRRRVGVMLLISVGGMVALPFAFERPLLGVFLAVAFVGLMWTALRGPAPRKVQIPRAHVRAKK